MHVPCILQSLYTWLAGFSLDMHAAYYSYLAAFIVEFEYPSYTVLEGESVEVCLVNTTNPERIYDFIVQFYTSYDSSTVTVVPAEAIGKATIIRITLSLYLLFYS